MKLKTNLFLGLCCLSMTVLVLLPQNAACQENQDASATALVQEIETQQKTIEENQAKIEAKLAEVEEELRVARIYVSRGGRTSTKK